MSTTTIFPTKLNSASIILSFDMISMLEVGETISGATVDAAVASGIDASPSAVISGSATITGQIVTQLVTGGVIGVTYILSCVITTSLGATKIMRGYLAVIDTNPFEA
jgi:hypothetical protein